MAIINVGGLDGRSIYCRPTCIVPKHTFWWVIIHCPKALRSSLAAHLSIKLICQTLKGYKSHTPLLWTTQCCIQHSFPQQDVYIKHTWEQWAFWLFCHQHYNLSEEPLVRQTTALIWLLDQWDFGCMCCRISISRGPRFGLVPGCPPYQYQWERWPVKSGCWLLSWHVWWRFDCCKPFKKERQCFITIISV